MPPNPFFVVFRFPVTTSENDLTAESLKRNSAILHERSAFLAILPAKCSNWVPGKTRAGSGGYRPQILESISLPGKRFRQPWITFVLLRSSGPWEL